ncbi:glycosyltransferase family 2 protein [Ornithinibacillus californiensis]|uniref:glycosyltransferase family 2 protein n=1 Tax=Ornithinibacillus californiensis TaxID=161536 RepID=UPI00069CF924|nr:glycosyltransferase family 2 protein [Ornithinibacillus californiensis]
MVKFSICIPTYNRMYSLKRTLKSLEKQTFTDFEVIIVDDGSTDNTEEQIKIFISSTKLKVRYVKKENGGKYTALNTGIKEANGEFFLILDSDDYLTENALKYLYNEWENVPDEEKENYCGVVGRCADQQGNLIGKPFPKDRFESSYVDFHFISGLKYGPYRDCCEFVKTSIIKQYSFPVNKDLKFIPEAYIFDQIGVNHKLLCTNEIVEIKEYLPDGITQNVEQYKESNVIGYLLYYTILLDYVFLETKESVPMKSKAIVWWGYWKMVSKDIDKKGPRCQHVSFLGRLIYLFRPILTSIYKVKRSKKIGLT